MHCKHGEVTVHKPQYTRSYAYDEETREEGADRGLLFVLCSPAPTRVLRRHFISWPFCNWPRKCVELPSSEHDGLSPKVSRLASV